MAKYSVLDPNGGGPWLREGPWLYVPLPDRHSPNKTRRGTSLDLCMAGSRFWGKLKLCTHPPQRENTGQVGRLRAYDLGKALTQYGPCLAGGVRSGQCG